MPFTVGQKVFYIDGYDEETEIECTVIGVITDEQGTSYDVECRNGAVTTIEEKDLYPREVE